MDCKGVALVTGASRGIGRAIAMLLAQDGWQIAINCRERQTEAEAAAAVIRRDTGRNVTVARADVGNRRQVDTMVSEVVDKLGCIDLLVNNAGINRDALFLKMSDDEWDEVIATNLKGTYNCCKAVLPAMVEANRGRIINIASYAGQRGRAGQTNYAAAKGGMISFTKALAAEMARYNITVNAVIPGFTETEMTDRLSEKALAKALEPVLMGRREKPEEVGRMVTFLAHPLSGYITGQVFNVDCRIV